MTVRFTPAARRQFLKAIAYIQQDRPIAASRFRKTAGDKLRRLETFPESGREIPEFPDLSFRELIVAPYRFFYRQQRGIIWIVGVWHGAQLPDRPTRPKTT